MMALTSMSQRILGKYIIEKANALAARTREQKIYLSNLTDHQKAMMKKSLPKKRSIQGVENVILVSSCKGGVGKSTTAVNLALALAKQEPSVDVGILDVDVFGPSIPTMMNLSGSPRLDENNRFIPLQNYDLKCMSMGFLVDKGAAVVSRGPMVMSAVQQLLFQTAWGSLKYLILDLPPGTGDTQLSILQLAEVHGAVIVSTPQEVALGDVRRGVEMFNIAGNTPILGCVQNMSIYLCPKCGHSEHLFGKDGAKEMSSSIGIPFLGDIPFDLSIRQGADSGLPVTLDDKNVQAGYYMKIAENVRTNLESSKAKLKS